VPATTPVALYAGIQDEVDVGGLAARRLVAYPRMDGDALAFHVTSPAALVPGRFGIAEPAATAPRVALHELGAIVMPLLAVDPRGHRLGWGRGYYDRTLASHHSLPPLLGAAFACQLVARVPADAHDVPVHLVFTEAGIAGGPGWPAVRSAPGA